MKKVIYGLMAAALSLGLAAPSLAASAPRVDGTSHIVKVQSSTTTQKKTAKKKKSSKSQTAKKPAAKKKSTQG